jgi:hypothetical protein
MSLTAKGTPDAGQPPRDQRSLARLNETRNLVLFAL